MIGVTVVTNKEPWKLYIDGGRKHPKLTSPINSKLKTLSNAVVKTL